jgi:hypothetical protein
MRPNLALGPIDSMSQYLLYLSIVVLGVLLPLLLNKWRSRREAKALLVRTVLAIDTEIAANRRRVVASIKTVVQMRDRLGADRDHRLALRRHRIDPAAHVAPPEPVEDAEHNVSVPLLTRTAWDVARLADALVLLPDARLGAYTRVFQMQDVFDRDRSALLQTLMQIELLDLPADMTQLGTIDSQLQTLTLAHAVLRYQVGLLEGMIATYDAALAATGT